MATEERRPLFTSDELRTWMARREMGPKQVAELLTSLGLRVSASRVRNWQVGASIPRGNAARKVNEWISTDIRQDPNAWQVCPVCHGEGQIVNPVLSVWTQSDREQDPDRFQAMMAGRYDQRCPCCNGFRVAKPPQIDEYMRKVEDEFVRRMESGEV